MSSGRSIGVNMWVAVLAMLAVGLLIGACSRQHPPELDTQTLPILRQRQRRTESLVLVADLRALRVAKEQQDAAPAPKLGNDIRNRHLT